MSHISCIYKWPWPPWAYIWLSGWSTCSVFSRSWVWFLSGTFCFFHACVMLINFPFTQSGIFHLSQTNKCPVSWQWVKNGWQIPQKRFLYSRCGSSPAESPSEPDSITRLFFALLFFDAAFLLGRLLLY